MEMEAAAGAAAVEAMATVVLEMGEGAVARKMMVVDMEMGSAGRATAGAAVSATVVVEMEMEVAARSMVVAGTVMVVGMEAAARWGEPFRLFQRDRVVCRLAQFCATGELTQQ